MNARGVRQPELWDNYCVIAAAPAVPIEPKKHKVMAEDAHPPAAPDSLVPALSRESTGLSVSGRTPSSLGFQLSKRPSSTARINEILENARGRAQSMAAGTASPAISPRVPGSPMVEDSSADEATGFISRTPPLNYKAFDSTNTASTGSRARRVAARSLRRSTNGPRQFDANPPASAAGMDYAQQGEDETKSPTWWQVQAEKFQSIELENKGSVARDHLAIERTFLAWLRTSLSFASIGVAITQLFRLNTSLESGGGSGVDANKNLSTLRHMGKPLGTTFLGISILILFLGYKRYFQAQHWVMQGKFPASRGTIMIVAFVALAIMVASLVVVIAIQPSEREL
ncbi:hypothetical protein FZEAL_8944 [Fusarium zealandicum]|uniref:DUF202 domain-containing protein n=1 Tax=Fusarium zealandicum TaxID=1053134 RepID=A0A8H4UDJ0_9HYPO|nr:hypothetical protein FZEAL_8944 [Fusarium zealandicum]